MSDVDGIRRQGLAFAQEVLAGLPDEEAMQLLVSATRAVRKMVAWEGGSSHEASVLVEEFVTSAEDERQRIIAASGSKPWGLA